MEGEMKWMTVVDLTLLMHHEVVGRAVLAGGRTI